MVRKIIFFVLILITPAITGGCLGGKEKAARKDDAIPVKVMRVNVQDMVKTLEYVGNIQGQDEALVYPKVSGKIAEKVKEDGSPIAKGEVIAYIDRDEVGLQFEKAPVESPLTGVVGRVYVDIGSSVSTQTPIALVASMEKAEINLDIPERYLPKISLGQAAQILVDAYPQDRFEGKVTMISPIVELATRTAPIKITIDNQDKRLQSGMFAKVRLIIEEHASIPVILKEAVIGRASDTYVYIVENKRAFLRKVVLGMRQGPYYGVESGVKKDDLVVIMGQQLLRDGCLVKAEE